MFIGPRTRNKCEHRRCSRYVVFVLCVGLRGGGGGVCVGDSKLPPQLIVPSTANTNSSPRCVV